MPITECSRCGAKVGEYCKPDCGLGPSTVVAYQVVGPVGPKSGYCTRLCDYDDNGACRVCGCFDPARFAVIEFPTEQEDTTRQAVERLQAAGIEVRRV